MLTSECACIKGWHWSYKRNGTHTHAQLRKFELVDGSISMNPLDRNEGEMMGTRRSRSTDQQQPAIYAPLHRYSIVAIVYVSLYVRSIYIAICSRLYLDWYINHVNKERIENKLIFKKIHSAAKARERGEGTRSEQRLPRTLYWKRHAPRGQWKAVN